MAQNIPAALRNMNVARQDANAAKYHMENSARKAVGMEPLPERYYDPAKALGQINVNEFPNPDNPIKPKSARLWEDIFANGGYEKAKGGVIDMDRMRLELMNGKKKFLEPSVEKSVMYHGTASNVKQFKNIPRKQKFGATPRADAHFVSFDPYVGNQFALKNKKAKDFGNTLEDVDIPKMKVRSGANVMPVHAQVTNPFDIGNKEHLKALKQYFVDNPHVQAHLPEFAKQQQTKMIHAGADFAHKNAETKEDNYVFLESPHVQDAIKKMGHDAFYTYELGAKNLGIFDPKKIKSAIGNRGTYDINDPDITKAKGGSVKEPKNTVKAYKLFRVHPKHPGKLFPLFVNANEPVEMNKWVDAKEGEMAGDKVKSKIGPLAYRPGWHAGDLPVATHIGEKSDPNLTAPDVRPANHVWAEVEMPHDVDWQSVANERGMNPKGKLIARNAHITDQIPKGGHYRYKTNSNMTGNWLIGGAMKVNRVLQDKEVKAINKAAGAADLPRTRPFKAKDYGLAKGGVVAPDEWKAEEHVNYMAKGGSRIASIKEIEDYIRQKRGEHASKRVQRAADEIPNLENMYTPEALQHTFERQNAGLMSMNPADFEKFAERMREDITRKDSKRKTRNDEVLPFHSYLNHLAQLKGGFDEVPFLELGHRDPEYLPSIEGHEGRHRSRALSGRGIKKSLVQLMPAARMSMSMPKRNSEKLVQKLNQTLGKDRFVSPEGGGLLPSDQTAGMYNWMREKKLLEANRPQLPEVYKSGGATHAHHLDIEERPL
jgi:hypothetical protein